MEDEIREIRDTVRWLKSSLYGQDGQEGDITQMKEDIENALAMCYENKGVLDKLKGGLIALGTVAATGAGSGLAALSKLLSG